MAMVDSHSEGTNRFKNGIAWFFFVFFVPALFAAVLLGFVLQVMGVPVVKNVEHRFGLGNPVVKKAAATPASVLELRLEREKYQSLTARADSLQMQLSASQTRIGILEQDISKLHKELQKQVSNATAAKSEAQILVAMEPSQAALILAQMTTQAAAHVVAAMASTDAGPILAAMDPKVANPIVQLASKFAH